MVFFCMYSIIILQGVFWLILSNITKHWIKKKSLDKDSIKLLFYIKKSIINRCILKRVKRYVKYYLILLLISVPVHFASWVL